MYPSGGRGGFDGFDPSEWVLLWIGLVTCLAGYYFFLNKLQTKTREALDALEEKQSTDADLGLG